MTTPTTVSFTLNIPSDQVTTVTEALCKAGGFAEVSEANAKQAVITWIVQTVQNVNTPAPVPVVPPPITGLS